MRCLMLLGAICICESRHCCFEKPKALVTDPIIAIGAHLTILVSRNLPLWLLQQCLLVMLAFCRD